MAQTGLLELDIEGLRTVLSQMGEPGYRAGQVAEWVFQRSATRYAEMTNLPQALREGLAARLPVFTSQVVRRQVSGDGTTKLLLGWPDGATSECVLIPDGDRRTACVSTQVGCPVRCAFCASGLAGLQRQLTAGEIVEQALRVRALCEPAGRLSNVVFMGLGEPLANYDATMRAVRTINAPWGMSIAARRITISTVGVPKMMDRLAAEGLQLTLAISLHAATDALRRRIIPWADAVGIDSLVESGNRYFAATGREVTLEYILLAGVNDSIDQARRLAGVARRMRSNVNLIPYNPVAGLPFERSTSEAMELFLSTLHGAGVTAHLRRSRGLDIDAACGQLRRREEATVPLGIARRSAAGVEKN